MKFTAEQAKKLANKMKNKVSRSTKRKFLTSIKENIKAGNSCAKFDKKEFVNYKAIIEWLQSLGYICDTSSFTYVYIYWDKENIK